MQRVLTDMVAIISLKQYWTTNGYESVKMLTRTKIPLKFLRFPFTFFLDGATQIEATDDSCIFKTQKTQQALINLIRTPFFACSFCIPRRHIFWDPFNCHVLACQDDATCNFAWSRKYPLTWPIPEQEKSCKLQHVPIFCDTKPALGGETAQFCTESIGKH